MLLNPKKSLEVSPMSLWVQECGKESMPDWVQVFSCGIWGDWKHWKEVARYSGLREFCDIGDCIERRCRNAFSDPGFRFTFGMNLKNIGCPSFQLFMSSMVSNNCPCCSGDGEGFLELFIFELELDLILIPPNVSLSENNIQNNGMCSRESVIITLDFDGKPMQASKPYSLYMGSWGLYSWWYCPPLLWTQFTAQFDWNQNNLCQRDSR